MAFEVYFDFAGKWPSNNLLLQTKTLFLSSLIVNAAGTPCNPKWLAVSQFCFFRKIWHYDGALSPPRVEKNSEFLSPSS